MKISENILIEMFVSEEVQSQTIKNYHGETTSVIYKYRLIRGTIFRERHISQQQYRTRYPHDC